tara:strand:+ start:447 stop:791 length:345 start_codon:yes stop_codon:yes gene_type:complete
MGTLWVTPKQMKAMFLRAQQVALSDKPVHKKALAQIRQWLLQIVNGKRVPAESTDARFKEMAKERANHVLIAIDFVEASPAEISAAYFRRKGSAVKTPLDDVLAGDCERQKLHN